MGVRTGALRFDPANANTTAETTPSTSCDQKLIQPVSRSAPAARCTAGGREMDSDRFAII